MDGVPPAPSPAGLSVYVAVSQLLGLTVLATTGAWLGRYRGGVGWHSPLQFNAHPLCMVLGMVFLQGDALLVYRVFRHEAKRSTKALHALLHGLALLIALVGELGAWASSLYSNHTGTRASPTCTACTRGVGWPPSCSTSCSGSWAVDFFCSPVPPSLCEHATNPSTCSLASPSSSCPSPPACWAS
uniref:Transmembrane ascorbate-dependent reductase CYB561 n=1 Tax=Malurus cyaneus samueli TaxID=2593467 RepID=A0A8C5U1N4_9PASS